MAHLEQDVTRLRAVLDALSRSAAQPTPVPPHATITTTAVPCSPAAAPPIATATPAVLTAHQVPAYIPMAWGGSVVECRVVHQKVTQPGNLVTVYFTLRTL